MNRLKKIGLLVLSALLTACGSSGLDELKRLCEKDAGLTIYKTVEAEGYYDATSIGVGANLIDSGYQFLEFCNDDPKFTQAITEPGCWRVSKVKRESGRCYERLDKRLAKYVVEPYPAFLKDRCLAVEKIDKPMARYSYHSGLKSWSAKNGALEYTKNTETIMDTLSGKVVGSYITYLYDKNPPHSVPIACSDFIEGFPSYIEANFVESTIKSN